MLLTTLCSLLLVAPQQSPTASAPAPAAPSNDSQAGGDETAAHGLLAIAEREAARARSQLKEPIVNSLKSFLTQKSSSPTKGKESIAAIVIVGPDAVPILLDLLKEFGNTSQGAPLAEPATRALVGLFERTKNPQILRSTGEALAKTPPSVRFNALVGLELDHPLAVEIARSQLADPDAQVVQMAVRVLGRQKKSAADAAGLLRPLLAREGAPLADVIDALRRLEDKQSSEAITQTLGKSNDPATLSAAVHYLEALGGRTALPALRSLLLDTPATLQEMMTKDNTLLKDALTAVQHIGLREGVECHKPAEEILVDCSLKHSSAFIKGEACWKLGPYQNVQARTRLEQPFLDDISQARKANRNSINLWMSIADIRLRFEAWDDAIKALKKATDEDDKGGSKDRIEQLRAVAMVGQGKIDKAEEIFKKAREQDRLELFESYSILERAAAKDPKLRALFPTGG